MPENDLMYHTIIAAVIVAVFYLLSRVVKGILGFIGKKVLAKTATALDDRLFGVVLSHVKPLMIVIGLHVAIREVRKGVTEADITVNQILDYGGALLYIVVVLLAVKILLGLLKEIFHWYLEKISAEGVASLRLTLGPLADKVISILVGMVAVIVILDHFGINVGSLLVSLGVGSLALALAAQDTLANMIAGFVILVDRPFRVGDRIQLSSGEIGDVQGIGLRSTRILNFDANTIIVPNAELVKGRIINFSYPTAQMRVMVRVGVAYGTNSEQVRTILLDVAEKHPDIVREPKPEVVCTELADSSVEFTLIARAKDYSAEGLVKAQLREQIYKRFGEAGIEIPYPQRVVHMKRDDRWS